MQVVSIPSPFTYTNLYTLSGFDAGTSLIVTNNTSTPIFLVQASSPPLANSDQYPLLSGQTVLVHANADPIWVRGGTGPVLVQTMMETITPFQSVDLPHDMYTSGREGFRRIRVDVAQTSFFEGREFRAYKEWTTATTATYVIRATVPLDIVLFALGVTLEAGSARVETVLGGTPGGTFSEILPIFPANTMSTRPTPIYANQTVLAAGGTLTGGTVIDVLRAKAADNSNFAASVGTGPSDERGVAANTYYFRITLTGAIGVFKARWEERP